jgi:predicted RNA-binding Zn-ribbon protein involved in translation (DUF1610 family)
VAETKITFTCPRCGNAFEMERAGLKRADPSYRSQAKASPFLVQCPQCGGRWRYVAPANDAEAEAV